jgi:prephenate dehydrogenase
MSRRATVVGVGLIGGSIGMALREAGWHVSGVDSDGECCVRGLELGAIDAVGWDPAAEITFVAVPVGVVTQLVADALESSPDGVVTDVGGVKAAIVHAVDDPRFVGGHPMAGSELEGVAGADASMFRGANWVLTPVVGTGDDAFTRVRAVVRSLGAEVVTLAPERHDALVAIVSHVPHLTAASLVGLAARRSEEHSAVLRLAAGGFRDMTRIAAGHPGIWPDICAENRTAITEALDDLIGALGEVRREVAETDGVQLLQRLESARAARMSLPTGAPPPSELLEVRISVLDRKGEIASVAALASDLDVNIYDLEIAHSAEGDRGVIVLIVDALLSGRLMEGLEGLDYRPTSRPLTQG